jgi:hypothetical protein
MQGLVGGSVGRANAKQGMLWVVALAVKRRGSTNELISGLIGGYASRRIAHPESGPTECGFGSVPTFKQIRVDYHVRCN